MGPHLVARLLGALAERFCRELPRGAADL